MFSRKTGLTLLIVITVLITAIALLLPRIPQPLWYEVFADQRAFLGVPNFGDVTSNVAYAIAGGWGIGYLLRFRGDDLAQRFVDGRERLPYLMFFVGLVLIAVGSSYFHWHPGNARLVWDRLPMTVAFMSLISALIAERISARAGLWLLPPLLLIGAASVYHWRWSEMRGASDLRFYAAVQLYSVLFLVIMLWFPSRYTRNSDLAVVAGLYALAKIFEILDHQIFRLGHIVSGHTLKHLVSGVAGYWVLRMLMKRRLVVGSPIDAPAYG